MYNAEKYIADCLDSILAQTFQNFEVIVVDDCSTDKSCAIVESYLEKFSGRLTLSHMKENTGSGAMPRNKGMNLSRGEYIFFVDNDDLITPTALEEIYALAKDFDSDVVYCDDNYRVYSDGSGRHKEVAPKDLLVDKPKFEPENLPERVQRIIKGKYRAPQWLKLVRRNLIFENEIFFPNTCPSDDDIWTYGLVFYARKILRIPNLIYIRRLSEDSIMRKEKTPQQIINFWLNPVLLGLKSLDSLMSKHVFFQKNPQYRYAMLENFLIGKFGIIVSKSYEIPQFVVYETIKQKYGKNFGEYDVLISALCTALNTQQKISAINLQKFNQFAAQAQKHIAELESELKRKD